MNLDTILEALVDADEPELRVTWTNHHSERAWQLRLDCQAAGLKREALFADDDVRRPITFHDLRATGITWRAIRGDGPVQIQAAAGHVEFTTTQGYVREALAFPAEWFGQPFPDLPSELWGESWKRGSHSLATSRNASTSGRPQGESKRPGRVASRRTKLAISRRNLGSGVISMRPNRGAMQRLSALSLGLGHELALWDVYDSFTDDE